MKLKKLKMPPREEIDMAELDMGPEGDMGPESDMSMGDEMIGEAEGESMEPGKEGPAAAERQCGGWKNLPPNLRHFGAGNVVGNIGKML